MHRMLRGAAALLLAAVTLLISGCGSVALSSMPDPCETADEFLDAYFACDSRAVSRLVGNYEDVDLGLAPVISGTDVSGSDVSFSDVSGSDASDVLNGRLRSLLFASLRSGGAHDAVIDGWDATVQCDITFFDFRKLKKPFADATTETAMEWRQSGQSAVETDGEVMELLCTVLGRLTADRTPYITTETVTITLEYSRGQWYVMPDEALMLVLTGYAGK